MIEGMRKAGDELGMEVLFPMHPRTVGRVKEFDLSLDGIRVIEPVGVPRFPQSRVECRTDTLGLRRRPGGGLHFGYSMRHAPR